MQTPRRTFGLGARLALVFALLAALTALVTAGVSADSTSRQVNADIDSFLKVRSLDVAEGRRADIPRVAGNRLGQGNRSDLPRPADAAAEDVIDDIRSLVDSDAEVQLLNADGNIIVTAGVALPVEKVDEKFLNRFEPLLLRTIEVDGEDYRMITRHVEGGGAVQVAQSLSTTNALLGDLRSELLLVSGGISVLAALLGWGIAQTATRPLRRLTNTIETVAATEDLSTPVVLRRSDEIGRLSEEFDALLKTLGASRDQQQRLVQDAAHELRDTTDKRAGKHRLSWNGHRPRRRRTSFDPGEHQGRTGRAECCSCRGRRTGYGISRYGKLRTGGSRECRGCGPCTVCVAVGASRRPSTLTQRGPGRSIGVGPCSAEPHRQCRQVQPRRAADYRDGVTRFTFRI